MGGNIDDYSGVRPKNNLPQNSWGSEDVQIVYFIDENLSQFNRKYCLLLLFVQQYQLGCGNSYWEYKLGLIA